MDHRRSSDIEEMSDIISRLTELADELERNSRPGTLLRRAADLLVQQNKIIARLMADIEDMQSDVPLEIENTTRR